MPAIRSFSEAGECGAFIITTKSNLGWMKKLTPDYFGWVLLFTFDLCLTLFWLWLVKQGFNIEREYTFDLEGYSIAFVAGLLFIWNVYEIWILIEFLLIEFGRTIEFDEATRTFNVFRNGIIESLQIEDLKEVTFSGRRIATKTPTAHLSYSQLHFKSSEPLTITSFVLNKQELENLLESGSFRRTIRNRTFFEGIKTK